MTNEVISRRFVKLANLSLSGPHHRGPGTDKWVARSGTAHRPRAAGLDDEFVKKFAAVNEGLTSTARSFRLGPPTASISTRTPLLNTMVAPE